MSQKPGRDLTEGPIFKHLMRFVVPMSVGISASMAVGLIDVFWLGKLGTLEQAAVAFAVPISFMVFSVSIGLSAGAVAAISREVGRKDHSQVRRIATDALMLGLTVTLVVTAIGVATARPLFTLLGARGEVLDMTVTFMSIWYLGLIFQVAPMMAAAILRSLGDALLPSMVMITAAIVNVILDPLLIFGIGPFPRMEIAGAAWATVAAAGTSAVIAGAVVIFREKLIDFSPIDPKAVLAHWRKVARVGAPAALSNMVNPLALAVIVAVVARFGEAAAAGFGIAVRAEMFLIIPLFAVSAAIGPLTGQNAGADKPERVRGAFRAGFLFALAWSAGVAAVLALLAGPLAALFSADPATQETARTYFYIVPITVWGYGITIAASAGFNGLSRPLPALAMTLTRSLVLLAPAAWIGATLGGGVLGAFVGMAAANVTAGICVSAYVLLRAHPPIADAAAGAAE